MRISPISSYSMPIQAPKPQVQRSGNVATLLGRPTEKVAERLTPSGLSLAEAKALLEACHAKQYFHDIEEFRHYLSKKPIQI